MKDLIKEGKLICYYSRIDTRPRSQYMGILRKYREKLIEEYSRDPVNNVELPGIILLIPEKVKSEEARNVLETLNIYLDDILKIKEREKIKKTYQEQGEGRDS